MGFVAKPLMNTKTALEPQHSLNFYFIALNQTTLEVNDAIQKAKENDQIAFNFLLHTFWNDVYGFLMKRTRNENDAEDITIETFSKAFEKIKLLMKNSNSKHG